MALVVFFIPQGFLFNFKSVFWVLTQVFGEQQLFHHVEQGILSISFASSIFPKFICAVRVCMCVCVCTHVSVIFNVDSQHLFIHYFVLISFPVV